MNGVDNKISDDTPAFKKFDILGEKCQVCTNKELGCYKYCTDYSNFKSAYIRKWEEMSLKDQNTNPAPNKERNFDEAVTDLKKIIQHYSSQNQHIKAMEELGELIVAIAKGDNVDNIIEECIDAIIMIDQLFVIYGVSREEMVRRYNAKIDRTLERMKAEGRTI